MQARVNARVANRRACSQSRRPRASTKQKEASGRAPALAATPEPPRAGNAASGKPESRGAPCGVLTHAHPLARIATWHDDDDFTRELRVNVLATLRREYAYRNDGKRPD